MSNLKPPKAPISERMQDMREKLKQLEDAAGKLEDPTKYDASAEQIWERLNRQGMHISRKDALKIALEISKTQMMPMVASMKKLTDTDTALARLVHASHDVYYDGQDFNQVDSFLRKQQTLPSGQAKSLKEDFGEVDRNLSTKDFLVFRRGQERPVVAFRGSRNIKDWEWNAKSVPLEGTRAKKMAEYKQMKEDYEKIEGAIGKPRLNVGYSKGGNHAIDMGETHGVPSTTFNPFASGNTILKQATQDHHIIRTTDDPATLWLGMKKLNDKVKISSIHVLDKYVTPYGAHELDNFTDAVGKRAYIPNVVSRAMNLIQQKRAISSLDDADEAAHSQSKGESYTSAAGKKRAGIQYDRRTHPASTSDYDGGIKRGKNTAPSSTDETGVSSIQLSDEHSKMRRDIEEKYRSVFKRPNDVEPVLDRKTWKVSGEYDKSTGIIRRLEAKWESGLPKPKLLSIGRETRITEEGEGLSPEEIQRRVVAAEELPSLTPEEQNREEIRAGKRKAPFIEKEKDVAPERMRWKGSDEFIMDRAAIRQPRGLQSARLSSRPSTSEDFGQEMTGGRVLEKLTTPRAKTARARFAPDVKDPPTRLQRKQEKIDKMRKIMTDRDEAAKLGLKKMQEQQEELANFQRRVGAKVIARPAGRGLAKSQDDMLGDDDITSFSDSVPYTKSARGGYAQTWKQVATSRGQRGFTPEEAEQLTRNKHLPDAPRGLSSEQMQRYIEASPEEKLLIRKEMANKLAGDNEEFNRVNEPYSNSAKNALRNLFSVRSALGMGAGMGVGMGVDEIFSHIPVLENMNQYGKDAIEGSATGGITEAISSKLAGDVLAGAGTMARIGTSAVGAGVGLVVGDATTNAMKAAFGKNANPYEKDIISDVTGNVIGGLAGVGTTAALAAGATAFAGGAGAVAAADFWNPFGWAAAVAAGIGGIVGAVSGVVEGHAEEVQKEKIALEKKEVNYSAKADDLTAQFKFVRDYADSIGVNKNVIAGLNDKLSTLLSSPLATELTTEQFKELINDTIHQYTLPAVGSNTDMPEEEQLSEHLQQQYTSQQTTLNSLATTLGDPKYVPPSGLLTKENFGKAYNALIAAHKTTAAKYGLHGMTAGEVPDGLAKTVVPAGYNEADISKYEKQIADEMANPPKPKTKQPKPTPATTGAEAAAGVATAAKSSVGAINAGVAAAATSQAAKAATELKNVFDAPAKAQAQKVANILNAPTTSKTTVGQGKLVN